MKTIGVLSLQGGFARHLEMIRSCGHRGIPVRSEEDLADSDALILPGGESTTIAMLIERRELTEPIRGFIAAGKPVFGTCAGMILLAGKVDGRNELHFSALDISIQRNSYGSQVDSFEAELDIGAGDETISSFPGVFIRAPRIVETGASVKVLCRFDGDPVLVSSPTILAASFHPELTADPRIHRYFIDTFVSPGA
jgi:5'-phosphate synthase pdxT subunit